MGSSRSSDSGDPASFRTPKVITEEKKGALSFRNLFKMFPKRVQNGLKSRFEAFEFSDSDKE